MAALQSRMLTPPVISFQGAQTDPDFAATYLEHLLPGINHPDESSGLFKPDLAQLTAARAIIGLAHVESTLAAGLYVAIDGANTAWLNGIRTAPAFRGRGYASALVREALAYIRTHFGIRRAALTVRCSDDGKPRQPAFATYVACGFQPDHEPHLVRISGLPVDAHLGAAGSTFHALTMRTQA